MKKYTFGKSERLKGKKAIEELFKKGSSFHCYPFLVRFEPEPLTEKSRILISVPKKNHKSAVKRNRIKRRIKEAYRLNKTILENNETAFKIGFVYLSDEILSVEQISKKLIEALLRLSKTGPVLK